MRRPRDACRPMHIHPHIPTLVDLWGPGMRTHPHPNPLPHQANRRPQPPLRLHCRGYCPRGGREGHKEAVPLCAQLHPAMVGPRAPQNPPLTIQRRRVPRTQPRQQRRRTLDIREQQRHGSGRQHHHQPSMRPTQVRRQTALRDGWSLTITALGAKQQVPQSPIALAGRPGRRFPRTLQVQWLLASRHLHDERAAAFGPSMTWGLSDERVSGWTRRPAGWPDTMDHALEASTERFRDHLRRPDAQGREPLR